MTGPLLASRAEVDAGRLGFIGHSYGGRMALFAPAYDPRIRATVSNCQCVPYRSTFTPDTGLRAEFVLPGFAERHDPEEVYAGARRALDDRAAMAAYDVGHAFTEPMRRTAYEFLVRTLST